MRVLVKGVQAWLPLRASTPGLALMVRSSDGLGGQWPVAPGPGPAAPLLVRAASPKATGLT